MVFESGAVSGDWRSAVIVPLYKGEGERAKCKNYRVITLLNVIGKIYSGIFRAGRGCVDQVFTIKHIDEKARDKKCRVYVGFIDIEKAYDRVNREDFWQVLRMYDV